MSDHAAFEVVGGGGAPVPTASWPVGGATVYSLQPALNWYTSGGSATSFEVELINTTASEAFDGTADFTTTDRTVDLSAESVTLAPGANYEWRVRSSDATTTSDWSTSALFSTVAIAGVTAPTPSYPTGGALLYSTDARLSWYLGTAATGLSYTVTLTPDSGTPIVYPATTDLSLDVTGLTPGADYTWSVSASDGSTSAASVDAAFSVFQAVASGAGTAVASWPVAGGGAAPIVRTRKPTLSWWVDGRRSALSGFQVEWSTDATFATVEKSRRVRDANAASVEIAPALDWATTYYWRVGAIAQGESAPTAWSEGTFATLGLGGSLVPVASYPTGDPTIYTDDVTLSWYVSGGSDAVRGYTVEYATSSDFTGAVSRNTSDSPLVVRRLAAGQTYFWRVRARLNDGSETAWSSPAESFTMKSDGVAPVAPRVGSPVRGVTIATSTPSLSWFIPTGEASAHTFEVELSTRGDFAESTRFDGIAQLRTAATDLADGVYFWRVRSMRDGNASEWADAGTFSVAAGTSTAIGDEVVVTQLSLGQNTPNPTRGTAFITYALPEAGPVRLSVYDVMGREVAVLVDGVRPAGSHDAAWDGSGLSAGLYVYRLEAGGAALTKTLTLLR